MKVIVRGFGDGKLRFEDHLELSDDQIDGNFLPSLAEKHAAALAAHDLHMIEIEFPDEPDPLTRYFRFGTDPRGMVIPIAIDL